MYSWNRELTSLEISFNAIVNAIATNNGTIGNMAYGDMHSRTRNERKARMLLQTVGCDYDVALAVAKLL